VQSLDHAVNDLVRTVEYLRSYLTETICVDYIQNLVIDVENVPQESVSREPWSSMLLLRPFDGWGYHSEGNVSGAI
jgi:hypothetical protein